MTTNYIAALATEDAHPVDHNMTNHPPTDDVVEVFDELRAAAKAFGHAIEELCPGSREKALAHTNAEQALMWAIASIARNQSSTTSW